MGGIGRRITMAGDSRWSRLGDDRFHLSQVGGAVTPRTFWRVPVHVTSVFADYSNWLALYTSASPLHQTFCDLRATRRARLDGREVKQLTNFLTHVQREEGQTMAEYGVVLAVIALGVVVALGVLSGAISDAINSV